MNLIGYFVYGESVEEAYTLLASPDKASGLAGITHPRSSSISHHASRSTYFPRLRSSSE